MSTVWLQTSALSANINWSCISSDKTGRHLAAAISGAGIYTSSNRGVSWTLSDAPNSMWVSIASDITGKYLAAASASGNIYTSINGLDPTVNWTLSPAPFTDWTCITSDSTGKYLAAVSSGAGIYNSANYGGTWSRTLVTPDPRSASFNLIGITSDSTGNNLAACDKDGQLLYISINGQGPSVTWSVKDTVGTRPNAARFSNITSDSTGTYLAACGKIPHPYPIYTSSNGGGTWYLNSSSPSLKSWNSITSDSTGNNLAAVYSGGIWTSRNGQDASGGAIWSLSNGSAYNWTGIACDSTGSLLAATTNGNGIYTNHPRQHYISNIGDISTSFSPISPSATTPLTGYKIAGVDLSELYTPIGSSTPYAYPTNFKANGQDLTTIFKPS